MYVLLLENIVWKLPINPGGTIFDRMVQCVAYADDVTLIARTEKNLKETFVVLVTRGEESKSVNK